MKTLYIDCTFGLGGDMFLAGLNGLGVDLSELEGVFKAAGLVSGIEGLKESRHGMGGLRLDIQEIDGQPLRRMPDILAVLDKLEVGAAVRERSGRAFRRLAEAEARVHGVDVDTIHFHEVGAVDTLVDVVGAFWGLERLGVSRVLCSSVPWFTGTVHCAHGEMPLPAPATAVLLEGKPVYATDFKVELVTPTGALILDQVVDEYVSGPEGRLVASSLSYGSMDIGGGLRLFLLEADGAGPRKEYVWVLETHVDHLTGEELGGCYDALLDAGALDVLYLPGVMKKNRPGGALRVVCGEAELERVQSEMFKSTLTLGLRRARMERVALERRTATLATERGELEAKAFALDGETYVSPEYEALKQLAKKTGRSVAQLRYLMREGEETKG